MSGAAQSEAPLAVKLRSSIWAQNDEDARAEAAFRQVDKDKSGTIEVEEFDAAAK